MCFVCDVMGVAPIEYVEVSAGVLKYSMVIINSPEWGFYIAQIPPALVPLTSSGYRLSPMFYN